MPQHCKKGCLLDHIPEGDWNTGRLLSHSDNVSLTNVISSWHGRIDTALAEPLHLPTHNSSPCWLAPFKISLGCEVTVAPKPERSSCCQGLQKDGPTQPLPPQTGTVESALMTPRRWNVYQQLSDAVTVSRELPHCGHSLTPLWSSQLSCLHHHWAQLT